MQFVLRKLLPIILSIMLLLASGSACGEQSTWDCPQCGRTGNTGNYCGSCAYPAPGSGNTTMATGEVIDVIYPPVSSNRTEITVRNGTWQKMSFNKISTGLKIKKKRSQAYAGPDSDYAQVGLFMPNKQTTVIALYQENGFVFVDLNCEGRRRCVYFHDYQILNSNADFLDLSTAYLAKTTKDYRPRFGPGKQYDAIGNGSQASEAILPSGSKLYVFFEVDNWIFAEFHSSIGLIRAWLPVDTVVQ